MSLQQSPAQVSNAFVSHDLILLLFSFHHFELYLLISFVHQFTFWFTASIWRDVLHECNEIGTTENIFKCTLQTFTFFVLNHVHSSNLQWMNTVQGYSKTFRFTYTNFLNWNVSSMQLLERQYNAAKLEINQLEKQKGDLQETIQKVLHIPIRLLHTYTSLQMKVTQENSSQLEINSRLTKLVHEIIDALPKDVSSHNSRCIEWMMTFTATRGSKEEVRTG